MLMNLESMNRNWQIVRKFSNRYLAELIEYQGELNEFLGITTKEDYVIFMHSLTDEEYVGNMIGGIMNDEFVKECEKVLNGEKTIDDLLNEMRTKVGMN